MEGSLREQDQAGGARGVVLRLPPIIGTYSGGCFHVLDPRPEEVKLVDIAHALSQIVRYTGHVTKLWSVAAHSLEVSRRIARAGGTLTEQLCGLLHDGSEAYLVDVPRPIKPDVRFDVDGRIFTYKQIEEGIQRAIATAFGLAFPYPTIVDNVDTFMVFDEVANFFKPRDAEGRRSFMFERYDIAEPKYNLQPVPTPAESKELFIDRFKELNYLREREAA